MTIWESGPRVSNDIVAQTILAALLHGPSTPVVRKHKLVYPTPTEELDVARKVA